MPLPILVAELLERLRQAGRTEPPRVLEQAAHAVIGARLGHPASVRALHGAAARSPALRDVFGLMHGWLAHDPRMHELAARTEAHQAGRAPHGGGHHGGHHGGGHHGGGHHGGGHLHGTAPVAVVDYVAPIVQYVEPEPAPVVVLEGTATPPDESTEFEEAPAADRITDITADDQATGTATGARRHPFVVVPQGPRALGQPLNVPLRAAWSGLGLGVRYLEHERQRMNSVMPFADEEPEPWRRPWQHRRVG